MEAGADVWVADKDQAWVRAVVETLVSSVRTRLHNAAVAPMPASRTLQPRPSGDCCAAPAGRRPWSVPVRLRLMHPSVPAACVSCAQTTSASSLKATVRIEATGKSVELESPLEPDGGGARDIKMRNSGIPGDGDTPAEAPPAEGALRLSGVGLDDLIGLTHLHEPAILHVLCLRYASNIIYTYTGKP